MMINLDKFFVLELQERGFDVDYKFLVETYRASRERPACKARKARNEAEKRLIEKEEKKIIARLANNFSHKK